MQSSYSRVKQISRLRVSEEMRCKKKERREKRNFAFIAYRLDRIGNNKRERLQRERERDNWRDAQAFLPSCMRVYVISRESCKCRWKN